MSGCHSHRCDMPRLEEKGCSPTTRTTSKNKWGGLPSQDNIGVVQYTAAKPPCRCYPDSLAPPCIPRGAHVHRARLARKQYSHLQGRTVIYRALVHLQQFSDKRKLQNFDKNLPTHVCVWDARSQFTPDQINMLDRTIVNGHYFATCTYDAVFRKTCFLLMMYVMGTWTETVVFSNVCCT